MMSAGGERGESPRVEGGVEVPVADGGDVSVWRPVSRQVMERELARWKGLLDRLGGVDAGGADTDNTDTGE
jgi:hypothetical protein